MINLHNRVPAWMHNKHLQTASSRHRLWLDQPFSVWRIISLFGVALLCGCGGGSGGSSNNQNPFPAATIAEANRQLNDFVRSGKAPGVLISVTTPKGAWSKAFGVADKSNHTPMSLKLQSRIGSLLSRLGLNHTAFPLDASFALPHAHGYTILTPGKGEVDSTDYSPTQAFSAGQMISTIKDLTRWVRLLGNGSLLSPELQAERLKWKPIGDNTDTFHYMFGIEFYASNWLGHGQIPGYTAFALYNPDLDATIALMINTDKPIGTEPPCNVLMRDISKVFFPDNPVIVPAG